MKSNLKIVFPLIICVIATACNNGQNQKKTNTYQSEVIEIFPKGELGSKDFFTGNAYTTALVDVEVSITH